MPREPKRLCFRILYFNCKERNITTKIRSTIVYRPDKLRNKLWLQQYINTHQYTLCLKKKVPTFKLSVTLSNLNRFSKFLHCWIACGICYKSYITLPISPWACYYTTLGYQKFKFSANIQQIWKNAYKSHFHFFQCTAVCNCVCWVYICVFIKISSLSLNVMLIVDKHCSDVCCDEFPVPQVDRERKQVKEHKWHSKFYLQSVWRKTRYLRHLKY